MESYSENCESYSLEEKLTLLCIDLEKFISPQNVSGVSNELKEMEIKINDARKNINMQNNFTHFLWYILPINHHYSIYVLSNKTRYSSFHDVVIQLP